jgi:hypothetical protein
MLTRVLAVAATLVVAADAFAPMGTPLLRTTAAKAVSPIANKAGRLGAAAPGLRTRRAAGITALSMEEDFDLIIVGCGVGGHGAALHARAQAGSRRRPAVLRGGVPPLHCPDPATLERDVGR